MNAPRGLFLDSASDPQQDQKTLATTEDLFARTPFGLKAYCFGEP
jgi:hypothetical protein